MNSFSRSKLLILLSIWILTPIFKLESLQDSSGSNNSRISSIVEEIQSNQFLAAEDIILASDNYAEIIPQIVKALYRGSAENANILIEFSKATNVIANSLTVLKELRNEMKSHGHNNAYMLMRLARTLDTEVIRHTTAGSSDAITAQTLIDEIKSDYEKSVKDIFKNAIISRDFVYNLEIRNLCDSISQFDISSSDRIMGKLVNETYSVVSALNIAESLINGCSKSQPISSGLLILFSKLFENNDMNNDAVLRIAGYISKLKLKDDYETVSKENRFNINSLIERLPVCARNLNFAKEVCIRNRGRGEYLFSSESVFYNNNTRRAVFACDIDMIKNNGAWKVLYMDNTFYFKNKAHGRDYLYAASRDDADVGGRQIQSYVDNGFLGTASGWNVRLNGDFCYLKNELFKEYLYASDKVDGTGNRYVYTAIGGQFNVHPNYQWQIDNCE